MYNQLKPIPDSELYDGPYEGYSNQSTFGVMNYINNDLITYSKHYAEVLKHPLPEFDARHVHTILLKLFPNGVTPDGYRISKTDQQELARDWAVMRQEQLGS